MKVDITLYGLNSADYLLLKDGLISFCTKHHITLNMSEVDSVDKFIDHKIDSIPAIEIEGEVITGKDNHEILTEFGKLPRIRNWINNQTHV